MKMCRLLALSALAAVFALPPALAGDSAGDDFWRYANGEWERGAVIPAGNVSWGARAQLRLANSQKMAALYQAAAAGKLGGGAAKKTGDYYMAQLNQAAIDARGTAPLQPLLARIAGLDSKAALARYLGAAVRIDVDPVTFGAYDSQSLFGVWVAPGLHDTSHYLPYLLQGGLVLPSREAYLSDEPDQVAVRAGYRQFIIGMLESAGIGEAARRADTIIALETGIARVHAAPEDSADLGKADQVWRRAEFRTRAPGMDWDGYFQAAGLSSQNYFGVWQPAAVQGIAALVDSTPLDAWRDYLALHVIIEHARFLPPTFADRYFAFFDPLFLGPGQHRALWEHALNQTNTDLPSAGRLFAEHCSTPQARAEAGWLAADIATALGRRIGQLEWMAPATKKEALAKLKNMRIGIAYPEQWPDISSLDIRPDDAFGNMDRVQAFNYRRDIAKSGQPVDRSEWIRGAELFGINPMPLHNAMTIPVTELQPPFFDPKGPKAANYGALGARIGRFLALAFDNDGSRFDAHGQVRKWWNKSDLENFQKISTSLSPQLPNSKVLNSSVADLAGLMLAYDALQSTGPLNKEDQRRFFTAYAQSQRQVNAGTPPPGYKAAMVRNIDAWYSAFDVTPGQALYLAPAARVTVW